MPDEYRLDKQLQTFCKTLDIPYQVYDTEHFYTYRDEVALFFKGKKQFLMENFYRYMRKKHQILMQGEVPIGGKWNYDSQNRKKWKKGDIPKFKNFKHNVSKIYDDIKTARVITFGNIDIQDFEYPISRQEGLLQLQYFCECLLIRFGTYQDAMHTQEIYLFHSRISFALNCKLISPKDVITTIERYHKKQVGIIEIAQTEGFIRQILGWREYMRGMYWMTMPDYKKCNHFNHNQELPDFYWNAHTNMNCIKHAVQNSLDNAYAHHIQRLMVLGNYALLSMANPSQVDAWYLGVYIDAIEWVQLPNTRGMSQYADGGLIATKPYISSASYINKMSNYCTSCTYNHKTRIESDSCPFNSLYWNFLEIHREKLAKNRRMKMMYSILNKIPIEEREKIKKRAMHIITTQDV